MLPTPEEYGSRDSFELLVAAGKGYLAIDHRMLHALLDQPERTLPGIARFSRDAGRADLELDLTSDLLNLFAAMPSPEALPFLIQQIREAADEVLDEVSQAIVRIGSPAIEPLLALAEEMDVDGGYPDFLLASLGVRDDRILQRLLGVLSRETGEGAFLLGIYGDPAAAPALEAARAANPDAADAIHLALTSLKAPPVNPVEDEPFNIWALYPEIDEPFWIAMPEEERLEYLRTGKPIHRLWAAQSFIENDYTDEAVEALLDVAESDDDPRVRAAAWEALAPAIEEEPVSSAMLERIRDDAAPLIEQAALAVALAPVHGDDQHVRAAIERAYDDPATRREALAAMWPTRDQAYAPRFERHLEDPDPKVRYQAILGSGYLQIHSTAPLLEAMLMDPDWREEALFAYSMVAPGETTASGISKLLDHIRAAADGLDEEEESAVMAALDSRLHLNGLPAVFFKDEEEDEYDPIEPVRSVKVGRNEPCPCGSGKKYKKCCGK